jgi:hypothetical protein
MRSTGRLLLLPDREPPLCHKSHLETVSTVHGNLETVSTVRGSGWVAIPKCEIAIDFKYDRLTHPLPRTVLTVSRRDSFAQKVLWSVSCGFAAGCEARLCLAVKVPKDLG